MVKEALNEIKKILNELEALENSKLSSSFHQKTKEHLKNRLLETSDRLILELSSTASAAKSIQGKVIGIREIKGEAQESKRAIKAMREESVLAKKTLKSIKKKIKKEAASRKGAKLEKEKEEIEIRNASLYVRAANFFFRGFSAELLGKGHFKDLSLAVRKSGLNLLANSYVSSLFLNIFLAFIFGLLAGIFFSFYKLGFAFGVPPISIATIDFSIFMLIRNIIVFPLLFSSIIFIASYYYPNLEASAKKSKVNDELPFAMIHMSAIAGSGVEPTKIFKLISDSAEYKEFSREARKITNKINLYGYDLLTALKEVARTTPSAKVKDLFNGMTSVISTGGDLKLYLEKKADTAMTEYKLDRRKFAEAAGTYADIYTGLLVAAPLIFGVMIAIMAPLGGKLFGLGMEAVGIAGLIIIFILNIVFLIFVNMAQPSD